MSGADALSAFFSVGTREGRAITWRLWSSHPGVRFLVATLHQLAEVEVLERPRACDRGEVMAVSVSGSRSELTLYRSASAGYYDRHPEQSFHGCDRDLDFDGASAHLFDLDTFDRQLRLPLGA
jgi:hypothetical protein